MRSVSEAICVPIRQLVMVRMRFHELPCVHVSGIYRYNWFVLSFFFERKMFTPTDFGWWILCFFGGKFVDHDFVR